MKKIGVQEGLDNISDYLSEKGYSVHQLGESLDEGTKSINRLDAVVVSDYNIDMLGFSDTTIKVPMINASGLSPEEVKDILDKKIER
jgi:hypothetical protein